MKKVVEIERDPFTVGRDEALDCSINHPTISTHQCTIRFDGIGRFTLEEMGSKNGTYLGESRLLEGRQYPIPSEAFLKFAAVEALFIVDDPKQEEVRARLHQRASRLLVQQRKLTKDQVKQASEVVGAGNIHLGERLLLDTDLRVADWAAATDDAEKSRRVRGGTRNLRVAVAILVIITGVLLTLLSLKSC
jgi:pSer/pThr/pTyr-binding forkhead associated (FHA) protein